MKKITRILMGAVVAATLCFTGCMAADDFLDDEIIKYDTKNQEDGAEAVGSVDYTNDTDSMKRTLRIMNLKKKDIALNVIMENKNADSGLMGIIFNKTDNKDGTINFILLGYKAEGGVPIATLTAYKNISKEDFEAKNFNAGDEPLANTQGLTYHSATGPASIDFFSGNGWNDLGNSFVDGNNLKVGFVVTAKEGDTPYEIRMYAGKSVEELDDIADAIASEKTDDDGVIGDPEVISITNTMLGRSDTSKIEAGIGFYANVYANQTLKGQWRVADISHNPEGIIWEDEEAPNTLNIQLVK